MQQSMVALFAGVNQSDVSNYDAGRLRFVTPEKRERIDAVRKLSKAQLVLRYLQTGRTLTPLESLRYFGLHSLSQCIGDLKQRGHNIVNIGSQGPHDYAVYQLQENKQ